MLLFYRDDVILFCIIPSSQPQTFPTIEATSEFQRVVSLQLLEKDVAVAIVPPSFGIARDNYNVANELHVSLSLVTDPTLSALQYTAFLHVTQRDYFQRMPINALRRLDEAIASEVECLSISHIESRQYVMHFLANMLQAIAPRNLMADGLPASGLKLNDAVQCAFAKLEATQFVLAESPGCMLQHALLHLAGGDREQVGDLKIPRVEVITGPLNQGPLEAPKNAFEESKPPHIEHPVKGPLKPPGKGYEEEKPPIALHRVKHAATATLPPRHPPGHPHWTPA
ncbi:hypothetical protein Nepgr_031889 [Nepenthes gracilis]|uniref:Uncharacterized protein n=1 Tax=Nepenthes gracilis TaxID=150966 RepID=A0AAD3Y7W1_NEPGR|nr:hypothetical protein Nepgr_031889 [Nepenthes gracilis]